MREAPPNAPSSAPGKRRARDSVAVILCQCFLALVLLFGGIVKHLSGNHSAYAVVVQTGFASQGASELISQALPAIEIALGVWLCSGVTKRLVLGLTVILLIAFCIALFAYGRTIGWQADCGCLGSIGAVSVFWAMLRNLALAAIAVVGFACVRSDNWNRRMRSRISEP